MAIYASYISRAAMMARWLEFRAAEASRRAAEAIMRAPSQGAFDDFRTLRIGASTGMRAIVT